MLAQSACMAVAERGGLLELAEEGDGKRMASVLLQQALTRRVEREER